MGIVVFLGFQDFGPRPNFTYLNETARRKPAKKSILRQFFLCLCFVQLFFIYFNDSIAGAF